jgi:flagellar hook protein FlgE
MPSYSIPLSGLDANAQALQIISNNLANINTVGYKTATADFADLFYSRIGTSGSGNPMQQGTGTQIASVSTNFSEGPVNSDGVSAHVAIQGDGFFVLQKDGGQIYSRAGNFSVDTNGNLVSADGAEVLGYPTVNGAVNTNAAPSAILMGPGRIIPAHATSKFGLTMNLDASASSGTVYSTPVTVYDSLGGSHTLTATFTKSATADQWGYSITIPQGDLTSASASNVLASGTLAFNTDGTVSSSSPIALSMAAGATLANGAANLSLNWNLTDSAGNSLVTQTAGNSSVAANSQDGYASGSLQGFDIQNDGTIVGTFSNNQTGVIGQLALASFSNEQGLSRIGANDYVATPGSGLPNVGVPGSGGRGLVQGSAIEGSNVDIASQFALLIQAQRGYEANAKAVTTVDQMTQDAFNMKAGL